MGFVSQKGNGLTNGEGQPGGEGKRVKTPDATWARLTSWAPLSWGIDNYFNACPQAGQLTCQEPLLKDKLNGCFCLYCQRQFWQTAIQILHLPASPPTSKRDGPEAQTSRVQNTFSKNCIAIKSPIYVKSSKSKATCDKYVKEVLSFVDILREISTYPEFAYSLHLWLL